MSSPYVGQTHNAPTVMHYPPGFQQDGGWAPQPGVPVPHFTPPPTSERVGWRFRLNFAFQEDIPEPLRGLMITFCVFLGLHVFMQFLNVVAAGFSYEGYPGVVVSSVFLAIVTSACAYLFWYRPLYAAFRDRSGFDYACFALVFFGQLTVYPAQFMGMVPMWPGFWRLEGANRVDDSVFSFRMAVAALECLLLLLGFILYWIVFCFWYSPYLNPKRYETFVIPRPHLLNQTNPLPSAPPCYNPPPTLRR